MPAGFQVFDQFGRLKIDIGHRLMRFLGYTIQSSSGSLTHDGLLTGVPFAVTMMYAADGYGYFPGDNLYPIPVWFSGNQMFWTINSGSPTQIIQFGVR